MNPFEVTFDFNYMKRNSDQILTECLVIQCQLGDELAWQKLIRIWYPKLLRYAIRRVNDPSKAEDVVQITLEVMCKSLRKLHDPATFPTWIYRVLHNKSVDFIRQKQQQVRLDEEYKAFCNLSDGDVNQEATKNFEVLLAGLPALAYELVHLHYLEGLSMSEISKIIGVPPGTVKSRLYYARKHIKSNLKGDFNG
ncbi:RNA polymerase sigma factor [Paraglaciecola sp. 2405UD69-4]|uniref:RNA polymerase sigma factor n=1 Tax=Paraglaciecola sp. 2405UD69-4 TaxID=3391836 RepID=UPI0039C8F588